MARDAGSAVFLTPQQAQLAAEVGGLLERGELTLKDTSCICGLPDHDAAIAQVDRYGLPLQTLVCLGCDTVRANPYLDEPSLKRFYEDYYQDLYARAPDPQAYFEAQKKYGARMLGAIKALAPESRSVIEVGCGAGGALAAIAQAGLKVAGCDHSERLVRFGQSKGMDRLAVGDLARLIDAVPDLGKIDVVYLHHVFEHMSDPAGFLRACAALINPTGMVICIVPDISRIDRFPFPGGDVRLFLHMAHKFNYSRRGLELLGGTNGYSVTFIDQYESAHAPEMWAVFRPQDMGPAQPRNSAGQDMLGYLRRTEIRYRLGLLPGYEPGMLPRIRRVLKTLLPAPFVAWLGSVKRKLRSRK